MAAARKMYGVRLLPALMVLSLLCVAVAIALLLLDERGAGAQVRVIEQQVSDLVMLSQRLPVQANAALGGADDAFDVLAQSRERFDALSVTLGARMQQVPAATEVLRHSEAILGARSAIQEVRQSASELRTLLPQLMQSLGNLASTLDDASMDELARRLERFELTATRLQQDLHALAGGSGDVNAIARRLADGNEYLGQVLAAVGTGSARTGGPSEARYREVNESYRQLGERVRAAISAVEQVRVAREANAALALSADAIFGSFSSRESGPQTPLQSVLADATLPIALLAAGLIMSLLATIGYIGTGNIRKSLELQAAKNVRNQEAILRLLDELSSLADGDLTGQATVSEDITGAIADSINYAIEALRELVATINQSALSLDASAREAQSSADELSRASVNQSKQVALASEAVAAMATSTEEISGNAERSADVARHSVEIAHKGGVAVRRTIDGMNAIRETIQETSKRIKRLGESSQEIGNIVELINDIAEQTNILALNASIQASMAGEAGRGFAVVADEVQRLAERAANATKQIEVLVRTIQADTNEAVVSMERSTTDVVGGALLAENAGSSLEEIEQVSNQIATLVQNISGSSRQQAAAAQNMARNMDTLREISSQTAENSATTSNSVTKLAQLSAQLRESVSGFRLPQSVPTQVQSPTTPAAFVPMVAPQKRAAEVAALAAPALMPPKKVSGLGA